MGVDEALDQAEQKQPGRKPPQLRKQKRYRACELEKIMDVVKHHQHQGDDFESGAGQPGAFCGKHTKKTPFTFYCKQCNRGLCRDSKFYIKNQAKVMLASKADLPSRSPLK